MLLGLRFLFRVSCAVAAMARALSRLRVYSLPIAALYLELVVVVVPGLFRGAGRGGGGRLRVVLV